MRSGWGPIGGRYRGQTRNVGTHSLHDVVTYTMKKDGLTMSKFFIGIYTAFRSPGWSMDFWCECFALPSACRFSDVYAVHTVYLCRLYSHARETSLSKFHQALSLCAVLRMTKLFTRLQRGETRTMQETCLSVPGRSGERICSIAVWCFPSGLLVSLHTSSLRPLQWWEKLPQSFSSLTTIMSCRLECSCVLAVKGAHPQLQ